MSLNFKWIKKTAIKIIKHFPLLDSKLLLARRKRLSQGKGYPDWQRIIKNNKQWQDIIASARQGQKVLIATSIGSHLAAMQMETMLAAALTMRGANTHALLCDELLPGCQMCEPRFFSNNKRFVENGPAEDLCRDCYKPGLDNYKQVGVQVHSYSENLLIEEKKYASDIASKVSFADIENFELHGYKIGMHVKAGALRFFARAVLDDEPLGESVMRRYLEAAILTALSIKRLIQKEKFDVVVFNHGIYVPQGLIGEVARQEGVRVVNWNPAYRTNTFIFSHNDTYHYTMMDEPVSVWEDMPWDNEREQKIDNYLLSRRESKNDWISFQDKPFFNKNRILSEIGCDTSRPIVGLLTNVMWDAQLHFPANAFSNMLEWLLFTIRYFEERPDLQLVIRVHPAEISGSVPTRQPVIDEIKKYFPTLPSNVYIIPPQSNICTYALSELCDSVIIYGTKTGVELASLGIPVIVAGEAWIRNKGLTTDADSKETYSNILHTLPIGSRLSDAVVQRAKKYAYHFFFRRMIQVNIFKKGAAWPPYKLDIEDISGLKNGSDAGLDNICNGILKGNPFIADTEIIIDD